MEIVDFLKIVLTKEEKNLFYRFKNDVHVEITWGEAYPLTSYDLISPNYIREDGNGCTVSDGTFKATSCGNKYFEYLRMRRIERFSCEARGWITTLIAVAALILSIISLLLKSVK